MRRHRRLHAETRHLDVLDLDDPREGILPGAGTRGSLEASDAGQSHLALRHVGLYLGLVVPAVGLGDGMRDGAVETVEPLVPDVGAGPRLERLAEKRGNSGENGLLQDSVEGLGLDLVARIRVGLQVQPDLVRPDEVLRYHESREPEIVGRHEGTQVFLGEEPACSCPLLTKVVTTLKAVSALSASTSAAADGLSLWFTTATLMPEGPGSDAFTW